MCIRDRYALAQGRVPVLVASLDALLRRTIPRQTLFSASVTLRVGAEYSMPELIERLTRAGYSRDVYKRQLKSSVDALLLLKNLAGRKELDMTASVQMGIPAAINITATSAMIHQTRCV